MSLEKDKLDIAQALATLRKYKDIRPFKDAVINELNHLLDGNTQEVEVLDTYTIHFSNYSSYISDVKIVDEDFEEYESVADLLYFITRSNWNRKYYPHKTKKDVWRIYIKNNEYLICERTKGILISLYENALELGVTADSIMSYYEKGYKAHVSKVNDRPERYAEQVPSHFQYVTAPVHRTHFFSEIQDQDGGFVKFRHTMKYYCFVNGKKSVDWVYCSYVAKNEIKHYMEQFPAINAAIRAKKIDSVLSE